MSGKALAELQLTQGKVADMAVEYQKGLLLAAHIGRLKEAGTLAPAQISVGKLNNVREALSIARTARTVLDEIHALVIGQAVTGFRAFA